jgi:hypothetical protein
MYYKIITKDINYFKSSFSNAKKNLARLISKIINRGSEFRHIHDHLWQAEFTKSECLDATEGLSSVLVAEDTSAEVSVADGSSGVRLHHAHLRIPQSKGKRVLYGEPFVSRHAVISIQYHVFESPLTFRFVSHPGQFMYNTCWDFTFMKRSLKYYRHGSFSRNIIGVK